MKHTLLSPLPNRSCPLCGGPNACVPAACGRFDVACWCRSASFSPALLARIPPAQRGRACVCAACAAAELTGADAEAGAAQGTAPTVDNRDPG